MNILGIMLLPLRMVDVFTGFTFTDWEDFAPMLTVLVGLLTAGYLCFHRARQKPISWPLLTSMIVLSCAPLLPNIAIFFMAREFQVTQGAWPQVMVNDPKGFLGHISPRFDHLNNLEAYLEAFSGAWMLVYVCLLVAVKSRLSPVQQRLLIGVMCAALVLCAFDPGHLYAWWMD